MNVAGYAFGRTYLCVSVCPVHASTF